MLFRSSSTGELTWTPDDEVEIAKVKVNVVATDDGSPPLSTTIPLELDVQDDAAMFTYLTTIFFRDNVPLAVFYDRSKGKSIELKVGSRFAVSDIRGVVTGIEKKFLTYSRDDASYRMELGQSLRDSFEKAEKPTDRTTSRPGQSAEKPVEDSAPSDATQPSNVVPEKQSSKSDEQ